MYNINSYFTKMIKKAIVTLCVIAITSSLIEARLPKFITEVCNADDKLVDQCLLRLGTEYLDKFTDGVPEFSIPKLDPALLKEISIKSQDFNLTFSGATLHGLKKTRFNKFSFDLPNKKVHLNFDVDVTLKGPYDVSGRILVIKIEGVGQSKIDVKTNVDITIDYGKRKGVWKVLDRSFTYNVKYAHFDLTNLFSGNNKLLATTAIEFLNESWELVMSDIAPPAFTQIVDTIINAINKLFRQTSPEELFHIPKGFQY